MTDAEEKSRAEQTDQIPALGEVLDFPDEQREDERRWIVLYPEDYDNFVRDVEGNLGVLVDIDQVGELIRLTSQTLAELSHKDADGDDVLQDMIDGLRRQVDDV